MMQRSMQIPIKRLPLVFRCFLRRFYPALFVMVVSLGLLGSPAPAQTTSLRQQQIYLGDIAELTIEYESSIPSLYAIDTSILDADFIILDTRSSVSRVIEGNQSLHRMHWAVQLVPRRSGNLHIPPLKFGENHSEPMSLEVNQVSALQQARQNVFLEVEAYPPNPYPGQQTRIVTRLFHNLELLDAFFTEPKISQVQVSRSGRDRQYESIRDEVSYKVLERSMVLTSNTDEQLSIESASYRGSILADNPATSTRYIYRSSNPLWLPLRALPVGADTASWLPARQLEMQLDWDEMDAIPKPGDSVGVTLRLHASGLPGEALPADLLLRDSGQYRIYADQEIRSTQIEGVPGQEHFSGSLQQRYAIIFDQPGEIIFPALNLHWWNVELDSAAVASVAATRLTVSPNTASTTSNPATGDSINGDLVGPKESARGLIPSGLYQHRAWLLLLPFGMLMVVLLLLARPLCASIHVRLRLVGMRRRCLQNLKKACLNNDAALTRCELINWGRVQWCDHRISGLYQLARRGRSANWAGHLAALDAAVFGLQGDVWQGQPLWVLIRQESKSSSAIKPSRGALPGLYPHSRSPLFTR